MRPLKLKKTILYSQAQMFLRLEKKTELYLVKKEQLKIGRV